MLKVRPALLIALLPLLLILVERPAEAYVDPGSASYVFQLLAGALLGAVFLLRTYWDRLLTAVRSRVSRGPVRSE